MCVEVIEIDVPSETPAPASWDVLIKQIGELSLQIDKYIPAPVTTEGETANLLELGKELGNVLVSMSKLEERMKTIKCDVKLQEKDWQEYRTELCKGLETSAQLMKSLEQYQLTDLNGGFSRFMDELLKAMDEHDCKFRAHPAAHRNLFRQNREAIVMYAINGAWKTVSDINSELKTVAPVISRQEEIALEAVQRVEKSIVDYTKSLDDKVKFLVSQLEETDERTKAMENQLQNLQSYNKNLQGIVSARKNGKFASELERLSTASNDELATELRDLKAKSARLKSILEKKCECTRVQR